MPTHPYLLKLSEEVTREEASSRELRDRAWKIATASGALVTLLGGLLAIAAGKDATVSSLAARMSAVAAACFVLSTTCALLTSWPTKVLRLDDKSLDVLVDEVDSTSEHDALLNVAERERDYLRSLAKVTRRQAWFLMVATGVQFLGFVALLVGVISTASTL